MRWITVRDRSAFLRLTGVLFLVYMATGLWSPLIAVYTASLGATTAQIGLVLATYQATALGSQYWWGRRSDRLGRRKPLLLLGTAGLGAAYLLIASVDHYRWLFAARMLEGVAMAAYTTGSLALIGDLLEDQAGRGRLMGTYRTFGSLAFAIAALSGGWLADRFGLRVPFLVAAGCYLLACSVVARINERPAATPDLQERPPRPQEFPAAHSDSAAPQQGRRPSRSGVASLWSKQLASRADQALRSEGSPDASPVAPLSARRALWPFLSLIFTWTFSMGAVVSLWPVYMSSIGYSKTAVGGLWALAALGEAPWMIVTGHLSDRWGRKWVMLTGMSCMGGVFLAYTLSSAAAWLIGVQIVRSFAYACFEAPALLYATELGLRRQRGRLAGLYYSASGLGGIAGSTIGGSIAQQTGLPSMFRGVVALMLAMALVVARTMPRLRPVHQEPDDLRLAPPGIKQQP
jgi:MFS family permease